MGHETWTLLVQQGSPNRAVVSQTMCRNDGKLYEHLKRDATGRIRQELPTLVKKKKTRETYIRWCSHKKDWARLVAPAYLVYFSFFLLRKLLEEATADVPVFISVYIGQYKRNSHYCITLGPRRRDSRWQNCVTRHRIGTSHQRTAPRHHVHCCESVRIRNPESDICMVIVHLKTKCNSFFFIPN